VSSVRIHLSEFRDRPAGTIRITSVEHAAKTIIRPTPVQAACKPSPGQPASQETCHLERRAMAGLNFTLASKGVFVSGRWNSTRTIVRASSVLAPQA